MRPKTAKMPAMIPTTAPVSSFVPLSKTSVLASSISSRMRSVAVSVISWIAWPSSEVSVLFVAMLVEDPLEDAGARNAPTKAPPISTSGRSGAAAAAGAGVAARGGAGARRGGRAWVPTPAEASVSSARCCAARARSASACTGRSARASACSRSRFLLAGELLLGLGPLGLAALSALGVRSATSSSARAACDLAVIAEVTRAARRAALLGVAGSPGCLPRSFRSIFPEGPAPNQCRDPRGRH